MLLIAIVVGLLHNTMVYLQKTLQLAIKQIAPLPHTIGST